MDPDQIGERLRELGWHLAVAESLTGGLLSNRFAVADSSSEWYRGAVVAYSRDVKHDLLDVPPGPVVSEECARTMTEAVGRVLDAEVSVAVTGVGGPDPQDGQPPGTVWLAVHVPGRTSTQQLHLDGDPEAICHATCDAAVRLLGSALDSVPA